MLNQLFANYGGRVAAVLGLMGLAPLLGYSIAAALGGSSFRAVRRLLTIELAGYYAVVIVISLLMLLFEGRRRMMFEFFGGTLIAIGPLLGLALVAAGMGMRIRPAHPECLQCGYNLTGNESGVCPECGRRIIGPS